MSSFKKKYFFQQFRSERSEVTYIKDCKKRQKIL